MSKRKINSRAIRQLAEELFEKIATEADLPQSKQADFVTSLVRQWITYDGMATFFFGERQVYLVLSRTPLGRPSIVPEQGVKGWMRELTEDWKISPDNLPDLFDQLNLGQSAETVNGEGIPLRLWVNPKERGRGVEALVKEEAPPVFVRDYRKIASSSLMQQFEDELGTEEIDELASSVASQWKRFDGHACLFTDTHTQFHFKLTEQSGGGCNVTTSQIRVNIDGVLSGYGFSPDHFSDVIARINLGQQIEFRDRQGVRCRLWHDPKTRSFCLQYLDPVRPKPMAVSPPFLCSKCKAVLRPWQEGEREQKCMLCGHMTTLK